MFTIHLPLLVDFFFPTDSYFLWPFPLKKDPFNIPLRLGLVLLNSLDFGCLENYVSLSSVGKDSACSAGDLGLISGSGRSLEKEIATHSSILAWTIPWTEEPGRLQSIGSQEWI